MAFEHLDIWLPEPVARYTKYEAQRCEVSESYIAWFALGILSITRWHLRQPGVDAVVVNPYSMDPDDHWATLSLVGVQGAIRPKRMKFAAITERSVVSPDFPDHDPPPPLQLF